MGSWHAAGDPAKVVTLKEAMIQRWPGNQVRFAIGCETSGNDRSQFGEALATAQQSDLIIMALGENYQQNGEAASRSQLGLPGVQQELLEKIVATGKPVIVLVMTGRPLVLSWMDNNISAILNTWQLGTKTSEAVLDVLTGFYNPSGKLVMSFPRNEGQIPIYYNTKNSGRPFDPANKYTSKYIDIPNEPLYPFGFGLSYTEYSYSDIQISADTLTKEQSLIASVRIANTGDVAGDEIVQLYVRDMVGSITRPIMELKAFKKVRIEAGQSIEVKFTITENDLKFYRADLSYDSEPGDFKLMIGAHSANYLTKSFVLRE